MELAGGHSTSSCQVEAHPRFPLYKLPVQTPHGTPQSTISSLGHSRFASPVVL